MPGATTRTTRARHRRASVSCPPGLLEDLVGHWRLDDGAGSTDAVDSSGRGNDGMVHGLDASTAWVAGRSLGALGTAHAGWVQVAPSPSIDAIVDASPSARGSTRKGRSPPPTTSQPRCHARSGPARTSTITCRCSRGPADVVHHHQRRIRVARRADAVPQNTWVHLAGTSTARPSGSTSTASRWRTSRSRARSARQHARHPGRQRQRRQRRADRAVPGRIDELMLFSRALGAAEIAQLAAGATFPGAPADAGSD